jgi:hypothetical protein
MHLVNTLLVGLLLARVAGLSRGSQPHDVAPLHVITGHLHRRRGRKLTRSIDDDETREKNTKSFADISQKLSSSSSSVTSQEDLHDDGKTYR